ncbi:retrograde regulation protein [Apiospora kogelbergensis]|uniref:retrograde regulation protein n=1 Tax=Apiospora kogelbergensis TaxID=1337665 RepID=UPI00313167EA
MAALTEAVTLANFAAKMPKWTPDLPSHLYALVDMGSNGIRFSISDLSPPQTRLLKCLYKERAAISLFDALSTSPSSAPLNFPAETITLVSETLARFKTIADSYGVPLGHTTVFATEAMRKAENAASMLEAVYSTSGLGVCVLAPEVETLFGSVGARSGFAEVDGLFLDLGGGSVQMTYLNSAMDDYEVAAAQAGLSLPFGAAKLIKIIQSGEVKQQEAARSDLNIGMQKAFADLQSKFPTLKAASSGSEGIDVYLCGGGFRGYGSMLMHNDTIQPYPIPAVGAYTVSDSGRLHFPRQAPFMDLWDRVLKDRVTNLEDVKVPGSFFKDTKRMRKVNAEYEGKIFGMSNRRREQFPAIATVVEALVSTVPDIRSVTFCSGGNREGALLMKLPRQIRETRPLSLLRQPGDTTSDATLVSVIETLKSAAPPGFDARDIYTVFTLDLGPLFVEAIWARLGQTDSANAAHELHRAITRDPGVPGFTHLARATLALTLCARWASDLGPVDRQLLSSLRQLAFAASPEVVFWAEYFGAVAAVLTTLCPTEPRSPQELGNIVRFQAVTAQGKKKDRIELTILVSANASRGIEFASLQSLFKNIGKQKKNPYTVNRKVEPVIVQTS